MKTEKILVVERNELLLNVKTDGIYIEDMNLLLDKISKKGFYMDRSVAEEDERYKQIIPYLVYRYKNQYFLMQRSSKAGEQRLKNLYTLGIGGHVRESDLKLATNLFDLAQREFFEEINFVGNYTPIFLGILNDDSNSVGRVHLGLVFLLEGDSADISVKTELQSGVLMSLEQIAKLEESLEGWSKMLFSYLQKINQENKYTELSSLA